MIGMISSYSSYVCLLICNSWAFSLWLLPSNHQKKHQPINPKSMNLPAFNFHIYLSCFFHAANEEHLTCFLCLLLQQNNFFQLKWIDIRASWLWFLKNTLLPRENLSILEVKKNFVFPLNCGNSFATTLGKNISNNILFYMLLDGG